MNLSYADIGTAILIASIGISLVIGEISKAERLKNCDQRGGALVKVGEGLTAEKQCVIQGTKP